jgi:cytoskeletal protein CcmA (bactofilin family)
MIASVQSRVSGHDQGELVMAFVRPSLKDVSVSREVPAAPATPSPAANEHSPFEPAAHPELGASVIGTDLAILGDKITIISQNKLQIDGDIRGDVTGKQVTIGPEGSVTGTVSAEQIDVHGGVNGAIRASIVTLFPSSQVDGQIVHQKLSISHGAHFEGHVRRSNDTAELTPNLDPNSYASYQDRGSQSGS